ncbi:RNA-binding protein (plasmid) [Alkalihalophilus sp. As8PL]|uniref:RNA-binding protein n=1 Tax=Alkalihalophilus sp. As8PL TaxID=3237103 RepID=A0AB39BMY1_9BACI
MSISQKEFDQTHEMLSAARRYRTPVKEIVRSVGLYRMPVPQPNGRVEFVEEECVVFHFPGGFTGLCPQREFSEHQYRSLVGFTGTQQEFLVKEIATNVVDEEGQERNYAVVSVKAADSLKRERFWKEIESLEKTEELTSKKYQGVVVGTNPTTQTIFVKVEGETCFMKRSDWDYGRLSPVQDLVERNTPIEVKVIRFNKESNQVHVSRKETMKDPAETLKELEKAQAVVGRVSDVHPEHGIFITLDKGVIIKGTKPKHIEDPILDDIVQVRIQSVDLERLFGRGVIIGYPQGKKKVHDVGAFLYE